jgi:hypothetical protein
MLRRRGGAPRIRSFPAWPAVVLLLGRVDNTVAALADLRGYPTGLVFKLNLWWRIHFDCCQRLPWPVPM